MSSSNDPGMNVVEVWLRSIGSDSVDIAYASAPAKDGNLFIGGATRGSIGQMSSSAQGSDAFLAKINSVDGSVVWATRLTGSRDDAIYAIAADSAGGAYVAGYTWGDIQGIQNPSIGQSYPRQAFLANLNSAGSVTWIKVIGDNASNEMATTVAVSSFGDVFVAGSTEAALDQNTQFGQNDTFISKYNSNGSRLWTKLIGSYAQDIPYALATTLDGSVLVGGRTGGAFGGETHSGGTQPEGFVTKLGPDGTAVWTRFFKTIDYEAV